MSKFFCFLFIPFLFLVSVAKADTPNHFWPNEETRLNEWAPKYFTQINAFQSNKFRFVYHTVTGWDWGTFSNRSHEHRILDDPEFIAHNPKISCTIIDQSHRAIFRKGVGLILNVPSSNIVYTSARDAGSQSVYFEDATQLYQELSDFIRLWQMKLYSPDELLQKTGKNSLEYNEIGVMGEEPTFHDKVSVKAVVITAKSLGCQTGLEREINGMSDINFRNLLKKCGFPQMPNNSGMRGPVEQLIDLRKRFPILLLNI